MEKTTVRLEKKTKALEESRDGLLNKIADAKANLETYKKSSFGTQIVDQNSILQQSVKKTK
jgi:hypothetical protein